MEMSSKPDRQYGRLDEIRKDHLNRYYFAAARLPKGSKVLDVACGCGYGSWILHAAGMNVTAVDISEEAIAYAKENYPGPEYLCQKAEDIEGQWDAVVSFETLEHLDRPEDLLLSIQTQRLISSVPNQEKYPFKALHFSEDKYPHKRHYTPAEFESLLETTGHPVGEKFCQKDKKPGEVVPGTDGLFLIYIAK
jgi:SAM-dependent methyltransferase